MRVVSYSLIDVNISDEFPALVSTVKKEDKIKQALGGKQQGQQAKGKKKGRSVDPNLLGFAAPSKNEEQ